MLESATSFMVAADLLAEYRMRFAHAIKNWPYSRREQAHEPATQSSSRLTFQAGLGETTNFAYP